MTTVKNVLSTLNISGQLQRPSSIQLCLFLFYLFGLSAADDKSYEATLLGPLKVLDKSGPLHQLFNLTTGRGSPVRTAHVYYKIAWCTCLLTMVDKKFSHLQQTKKQDHIHMQARYKMCREGYELKRLRKTPFAIPSYIHFRITYRIICGLAAPECGPKPGEKPRRQHSSPCWRPQLPAEGKSRRSGIIER